MTHIYKNALQLIGNTPLVLLERIYRGPGKLYGKLESVNPGGSMKDRAALKIIQTAYAEKKLKPGQSVVEMTSGNTGAGLAIVCNLYGNPFIAALSAGVGAERIRMMRGLGTEIVTVPEVDGRPGSVTGNDIAAATERAKEIAKERGAFFVDQFNNAGCMLAHEEGTAPEIWKSLSGNLDGFVAVVGSGGTFVGCSRFFKKMKPSVVCAVVEPKGAEILQGLKVMKPQHIIQGSSYGIVPSHWDPSVTDAYLSVTDEEVVEFRDLLAKKEGLYVGYSSGANVCAAIKLLQSGKLKPDASVATILCDTGLKYSN